MFALRLKARLHLDGYINRPLILLFLGLISVVLIYSVQNYLKHGDHIDYSFLRSLGFNTVSLLGFSFAMPLMNRVHIYLGRYPRKTLVLYHFLFSLVIIALYSLLISLVNYSLGFNSKPFHEAFLNKYFLNMALFHWIFYWVFAYVLFQKPNAKRNEYLKVSLRKSKVLCPLASIVRIEAMDHYVKIFTEEECYLKKISLTRLEKELDTSNFVRVHRSHIINRDFVKRVESRSGISAVALYNDDVVRVGKTYSSTIDLATLLSTND